MAPLKYLCFRKVLLFLCFILFFFFSFASSETETQTIDPHFRVRRLLVKKDLEDDNEETNLPPPRKKKLTESVSSSSSSTKKNQTKLIKPISSSSKNQTKLAKTSTKSSSSNTTKTGSELKKLNSETKSSLKNTTKIGSELKKLNSGTKSSNSTSPIKKSSPDLSKSSSAKNKTTTKSPNPKPSPPKPEKTEKKSAKPVTKVEKEIKPFWLDDEEDDDFVSEFRDLPTKFQRSLIPDLERILTQFHQHSEQRDNQKLQTILRQQIRTDHRLNRLLRLPPRSFPLSLTRLQQIQSFHSSHFRNF